MEIAEIIGILLIALVIASLFYYGFGRRGPWGAFWVFLLILFLAAWAGRLWIAPAGPVIWGYAWLPLIFWVFIVALLIGAVSGDDRVESRRYDRTTATTDREIAETEPEAGAAAAFGLFFWILLSFLIIAILIGLLA